MPYVSLLESERGSNTFFFSIQIIACARLANQEDHKVGFVVVIGSNTPDKVRKSI